MKKPLIGSLIGVALLVLSNVSCQQSKQVVIINTSINHHVYLLDTDTMSTIGEEKQGTEKNLVKCGDRYKVTFDIEFAEEGAKKLPADGAPVNFVVTMGDFENDDNIRNLSATKTETGGGIHLSNKQNGVYEGELLLTKKAHQIDFTSTYLIVGVDTLVGFNESNLAQPVSVRLSSPDFRFIVNSIDGYYLDLQPVKGDFAFSEENITDMIGSSYRQHDQTVTYPKKCTQLAIEMYSDSSLKQKYGSKSFVRSGSESVLVNLADIAKEFMGQSKYQEMIDDGGFTTYFKYIAVGSTNYNDSSIVLSHNF